MATSFQQLLSHIERCHRNDPNFHCVCGINGCTTTFKKYYSCRRHILRRHSNEEINPNEEIGGSENEFANDNHDLCVENANHQDISNPSQIKRSVALYLLKLQEDCRLPKAAVDSVLANTTTITEDTMTDMQIKVKSCLLDAGVDIHEVNGLETLLTEDNSTINSFKELENDQKRVKYYKENFYLKVRDYDYYFQNWS